MHLRSHVESWTLILIQESNHFNWKVKIDSIAAGLKQYSMFYTYNKFPVVKGYMCSFQTLIKKNARLKIVYRE